MHVLCIIHVQVEIRHNVFAIVSFNQKYHCGIIIQGNSLSMLIPILYFSNEIILILIYVFLEILETIIL